MDTEMEKILDLMDNLRADKYPSRKIQTHRKAWCPSH